MKSLAWVGLLLVGCAPAFAQGTVLFSNFVPGKVDAPWFIGTERIRSGFNAQLVGGPVGADGGTFTPLFPTTIFDASLGPGGYVVPVVVTVPDVPAGAKAAFFFRVYSGSTYDLTPPSCRGVAVAIATLGGDGSAPGILIMSGASVLDDVSCIPEPRSVWLALLGAWLSMLALKRKRNVRRGDSRSRCELGA